MDVLDLCNYVSDPDFPFRVVSVLVVDPAALLLHEFNNKGGV